ncbi:hypothetical protein DL764_002095 [Monosporascus ibericus]|uniref:Uncharacterized protein n=1 Tax=Monosporascus ibericus TaxID=155417 RepID=A0A4Q4TNK7_9PEZI|nr:hypothetical protein DL764_002095 [Monosporascus ibericus]
MVTIEQCRVQRRGQQGDGALRRRLARVIVGFVGQDEALAAAGLSPPSPNRSPPPGAPSAPFPNQISPGCTEYRLTSTRNPTGSPPRTWSRLSSVKRTRSPPSQVPPWPAPVYEHQPRGILSRASATAAATA